MNKSLLELAREVAPGRAKPASIEELELIFAYLKGEITIRQLCAVLKYTSPGNASHRIAAVVKFGVVNGLVKLELPTTSDNEKEV